MLKMYERTVHHGGSAEYWDQNWLDADFEKALRICELDPLRPLFERCAPKGSRMLEGGCGPGYYVTYYGARGVKSIGLDFAVNPLARLRRRDRHATLCAGDVGALPFTGDAFDVYYSGGVVEHFEGGCEAALKECRRVLRPDGVLLISVPYFSPLRRVLSWVRPEWRPVARASAEPPPGAGLSFFQYAYGRREFERLLHGAGLRVRSVLPYSVLWGLMQVRAFKAATDLATRLRARRAAATPAPAPMPAAERSSPPSNGHAPSLLKRLIISEDRSVPVAGTILGVAGWLAANMIMFECVRDDAVSIGDRRASGSG